MSDRYQGLQSGTVSVPAHDRVVFGRPAPEALIEQIEELGRTRVFVVTGRSLAAAPDGPVQRIVHALGPRHVGTFGSVSAHSPRDEVVEAAREARACHADVVVAIGGGSVIDSAKAVLMCLWHGLDSVRDMEPYRANGPPEERRPIDAPRNAIRLITVSTSLSGAEFTPSAGITETTTNSKQRFLHRLLAPQVIILDPDATALTPLWLLASTGIRSVDHAAETYCSPDASLVTERQSLYGLTLLTQSLPRMWAEPDALGWRLHAQLGMWQAISSIGAGVSTGASHGIGYALGASFDVPHGHTSCVLLPAVMRWNAEVNHARQSALAEAMGKPGHETADLLTNLIRGLEQPTRLREVGITRSDMQELAERALTYPQLRRNPRPIRGIDDVLAILDLVW